MHTKDLGITWIISDQDKESGFVNMTTLCFEDDKTAIMTTENECSVVGHMKHVDIKFLFDQESIKMGEIRIRYISTDLKWADVLTKTLVPKKDEDVIESIIGSKEDYRLIVSEKEL